MAWVNRALPAQSLIDIRRSDPTKDERFDSGSGFLIRLLSSSYFLTELFDNEPSF
jgi:hypothetical protein